MSYDQTKISDELPRAKTWSAPELYLSQSEAQAGKTSIGAADLADIRQSDLLTGQIVEGKYRILDLIGEGAMAIVYEALDLKTNRRVAAKTLKYLDDSMVARFAREVEIHQKLKHPNIVEAVECVLGPNNICLFIMEVLEGMDLEEVLESQERIDDLNEFVSILHQICDGLEHAHKLGVIHRDLKPENIIVLKKGGCLYLKILDFGVAKIQEDLQKLTKTGVVLGSPAYMSPEQCMGKKLSERSDIYSLGALAFELLTGALPYDENTAVDMMRAHCDPMSHPLPIASLRPDTPAVHILQSIINTTLHYDPEMRYKNINELKVDLDAWWREAKLGAPEEKSPFTFIDPELYEVQYGEKKPTTQADDLSQLSNLIDSQRKAQVDSIRASFKEDKLPKPAFDKKKLLPLAIGAGALIIVSGILYGLSRVDFDKLKESMNKPATPVAAEVEQPAETQAKEETVAEQEAAKAVHRTKKRKILGPGQTAR